MKQLTAKQEKFCQCVANGMTQADAYREAFDVSPDSKPETAQENASRLMADSRVSARVYELRDILAAKRLWSREQSVEALLAAMGEGNASVKIQAVKELNAMHGFNAAQKHEHEVSGGLSVKVKFG